jgi:hypothetical protein
MDQLLLAAHLVIAVLPGEVLKHSVVEDLCYIQREQNHVSAYHKTVFIFSSPYLF